MKTLKILVILTLISHLSQTIAKADITFGEPELIGPPVTVPNNTEYGACISANCLELYFDAWTQGITDIYVATRDTIDENWGQAVPLGSAVNSTAMEWTPRISADGLELYFASSRIGSVYSGFQLYVARRQNIDDEWQPAENLGDMINSSDEQTIGSISANGLELYYSSSNRMYVATRARKDSAWTAIKAIAPTISGEYPSISPDRSHLFFSNSSLPGGMGGSDIWMMTRASIHDDWSAPVNLGLPINSNEEERRPWISHDGATIIFTIGGIGSDRWQADVIPPLAADPVLDFNSDGIVDAADISIMIDYWGTDEPLYDIAPLPFGDGIVDVQDLILLAEHLFEEIFPPELVAYWKLDENEGMLAINSVSNNDALVIDGATWQPDNGQVDGALQLNGVSGCAIADTVLNPADGPFSVFAWIKGGAPGQVVLSQQSNADWLAADTNGNLMTELKPTGRSAGPLWSQTIITDDKWHHIGLVWDGSHRTLYVDGIEVAIDTTAQDPLKPSDGGLYIGTGKAMEPGTYFSGLIDDVQVYNRAVRP